MLQWAHANGCPWDASLWDESTRQWARANGCTWARANGCHWTEYECKDGASEGEHLEVPMMERIHVRDDGWDTAVVTSERHTVGRADV